MKREQLYKKIFFGTVYEKLETAYEIYDDYKDVLHQDNLLISKLEEVGELANAMNSQMASMNMPNICTVCAKSDAGGCCSFFMSGENEVLQLLMNIMLGKNVELQRDDKEECCFLGKTGCVLLVKPMFCLNYNCSKITKNEKASALKKLEECTGKLLFAQYELEQDLIKLLRFVQNPNTTRTSV